MIALGWDNASLSADIALTDAGRLAAEDGLTTAVILSLFTDARARADDALPDGAAGDRRGWAADAFAPEDRWGSRLWLLTREKQTEETRRRARDYAAEALDWLMPAGLATAVDVAAEWLDRGLLGLSVRIATPAGRADLAFRMRF